MPSRTPPAGRPPILGRELTLVTGAVDSGKTSWCSAFGATHRGFDGVLLRKVFRGGRRIGYDAVRFSSGAAVPFSRLRGAEPPGWRSVEVVGPFTVSEEGKQAANRWLLEALDSAAPGLIVDEIGPLELAGGGLAASLQRILEDPTPRRLILVVRRDCLTRAVAALALTGHRLVEVDTSDGGVQGGGPGCPRLP